MLVGYFAGGKRYSTGQIFAGTIITAGIVMATISAPRPRKAPTPAATTVASDEFLPENVQYIAGIGLLALALLLSAWLGLWQEATYKQYGKQWREALFYCVRVAANRLLRHIADSSSTSFLSPSSSPCRAQSPVLLTRTWPRHQSLWPRSLHPTWPSCPQRLSPSCQRWHGLSTMPSVI